MLLGKKVLDCLHQEFNSEAMAAGKGIPCYHQGLVGQMDHGFQWDQQDQQHRFHQEDLVHPAGDSLI